MPILRSNVIIACRTIISGSSYSGPLKARPRTLFLKENFEDDTWPHKSPCTTHVHIEYPRNIIPVSAKYDDQTRKARAVVEPAAAPSAAAAPAANPGPSRIAAPANRYTKPVVGSCCRRRLS